MQPRTRYPLNEGTTITLDGSGNGTAKLGPRIPREVWYPNVAAITIPGLTVAGFVVCRVYVGPQPTPLFIVDTSYLGGGDSTGRVSGYPVRNGEFVWAVWSAGPLNTQASLSIFGEVEIP